MYYYIHLFSFRWVSSPFGCPNASLVMKVDDDALIHPVRLPKLNKTLHQALAMENKDIYLGKSSESAVGYI